MAAAKKTEDAAHNQAPLSDETVTDATTAEASPDAPSADDTAKDADRAESTERAAQRDDRPVWDIATHGNPDPGTESIYRVINSSARR